MKRFERKKTPLSSPYTVFQEITKKNLDGYNYNNNRNINQSVNISNKGEWNENYSNKYSHSNYKENKPLSTSMSAQMIFDNRKSEITNPELFYKRNNNDYFKYRAEQKKYLDYNYQMMINKSKSHHKQEPNINPYNPKKEDFEHYKSDLAHNPILNPVNYYSYNKYLEKEIKESNNRYYDNNNNNINIYDINRNNNRGLSPFQQAGNQLLINK